MATTHNADRPRKPWYRPRNIILLMLLALGIYAAYLIHWAYTAEPDPSVDYAAQLEQLSADAQPPGENAWPILVEATSVLDELEATFPKEDRHYWHQDGFDFYVAYEPDRIGPAMEDAERQRIIEEARNAIRWLQTNGAFELIQEAAACPRSVRPWKGRAMPFMAILSVTGKCRDLAIARTALAHLAIADGRISDAIAAVRDLHEVAGMISYQPTVIHMLVGMSIAGIANDLTIDLAQHESMNADDYGSLLETLRHARPLAPISLALEGERRNLLDLIQRTYTDDGDGNGTLLYARLSKMADSNGLNTSTGPSGDLSNLIGLVLADRRGVTDKTNEVFDELIRLSQTPVAARRKEIEMFHHELDSLGWQHVLLRLMMPALDKAVINYHSMHTRINGATLLAAIELYRAENAEYPQSLDELTPDILDQLPTDHVSGQPFGYKTLNNDEHGRMYLLYSFGRDAEDNNGHYPAENTHAAFLEDEAKGYDYVVNRPPGRTSHHNN